MPIVLKCLVNEHKFMNIVSLSQNLALTPGVDSSYLDQTNKGGRKDITWANNIQRIWQ